jgi:hypothetical protein
MTTQGQGDWEERFGRVRHRRGGFSLLTRDHSLDLPVHYLSTDTKVSHHHYSERYAARIS